MLEFLSPALAVFLKLGAVALVINEIRGLILAAPVLWAIYEAGGTLAAIWVGVSSLAGIALSVAVPLLATRKLRKRLIAQA